ncbi:glutathione S-transferase family protein [Mameliella alba]|uniref:glutathione S-transferase family protein n=1 Tax=Mameliella alba TaxID=561184 RepID=UPI000B530A2B|nr:glutathione S-transferase family protein [Mameliella alba]MBY6122708.1 glutathione S-transferase family protein [Mameliella alba]OWV36693.1 glutathione S-transferase [Mameliella alba]OWV51534.1 glutathione S-transferase [Mameliella alba]
MTDKPIVYHIPVCPFSQRLEILLALRGTPDAVVFRVVDITKPRDPELLRKTRGTTALPVLETPCGSILKESLVILRYLDEMLPGAPLRRPDPFEHAVESMLIAREGPFTTAGYLYVLNQEPDQRATHRDKLLGLYRDLDGFLCEHSPEGSFLFEDFGLAEAVFTPMFKRFWFLEYYEDFALPEGPEYDRVRRWHAACMAHPATDQVCQEEIVKLYYDYALGAGNGALVDGRNISSFVFEPHWRERPMPPRDKYAGSASDADLGLA